MEKELKNLKDISLWLEQISEHLRMLVILKSKEQGIDFADYKEEWKQKK